jgi:serine/threonine-protein kinase
MRKRRGGSLSGDPSLASDGLHYSRNSTRTRRAAAESMIGRLIDRRYRVVRIIGEGGMGVVFAAEDSDSCQLVALKALHPTAFTEENQRRFLREARATFRLRHPNICQVFAWGTLHDRAPYFVMELLDGQTLRARLREGGALRLADAVAITMQLTDGLTMAHSRGVLHRDVKPGNVFVVRQRTRAPKVKLIDFGLAKLLPTNGRATLPDEPSVITKTGVTPGTPHYLSPEQIDGARDVDERADVWALGLVMYEMLVGRKAFDGETYQELAASIALDEPKSIRAARPDVPEQLEKVIRGALVKDRRYRYANAHLFRDALLDCWAQVRAEDIARTRLMTHARTRPSAPTEPEVDVPIYLDSSTSVPTVRRR